MLALVAACLSAGAQSAEDRIAACVDDLRLPTAYPEVAHMARIQSVVVAEVIVPSEGQAPTINFLAGHQLFNSVVETPLLESIYDPACAGEPLLFHFKFSLDGLSQDVSEVVRAAPGLIHIERGSPGLICALFDEPPQPRLKRWALATGRAVSTLGKIF